MTTFALHNIAVEQNAIGALLEAAAMNSRGDCYSGKRSETRYAASIRLEVLVDQPDEAEVIPAELQNIGHSGLAMRTRQPIDDTLAIFIRVFKADGSGEWFGATIRHCSAGMGTFLIGVEFHHPLPDSWRPGARL